MYLDFSGACFSITFLISVLYCSTLSMCDSGSVLKASAKSWLNLVLIFYMFC